MISEPDNLEDSNPRLKAAFLEVVENQLRDDTPPETRKTLARLLADGISEEDARIFIAQAVAVEVWDTLRNKKPFDPLRYARNLEALPEEPRA